MNYQRIYDQIITRAQSSERKRVKGGTYFEKHHILPKCLGGSNLSTNKVLLTAREHYICHKLLVEIYIENRKILHSYRSMIYRKSGGQVRDYIISARDFERARITYNNFTTLHGGPRKGMINSQEHNKKISEAHVGMKGSELTRQKIGNIHRGKVMSAESKRKMSVARSGDHHWSYHKVRSDESKQKAKNTWSLKPKIKCPYCDMESINLFNLKKYHFDNCKHKSNSIS